MSTKDFLEKDYYKTLGVSKDAKADEIKKAYRKLARTYHPDANKGDVKSEDRFKEISEAYDVLSDTTRRKEYDDARALFGSGGPGGFRVPGGAGGGQTFDFGDIFGGTAGGNGGLGDLLGGIFGGRGAPGGPRPPGTRGGGEAEARGAPRGGGARTRARPPARGGPRPPPPPRLGNPPPPPPPPPPRHRWQGRVDAAPVP